MISELSACSLFNHILVVREVKCLDSEYPPGIYHLTYVCLFQHSFPLSSSFSFNDTLFLMKSRDTKIFLRVVHIYFSRSSSALSSAGFVPCSLYVYNCLALVPSESSPEYNISTFQNLLTFVESHLSSLSLSSRLPPLLPVYRLPLMAAWVL